MTTQPVALAALNRTLDQELCALVRGASHECLVCGEFVLELGRDAHSGGSHRGLLACPECRSILAQGSELPEIELPSAVQAG